MFIYLFKRWRFINLIDYSHNGRRRTIRSVSSSKSIPVSLRPYWGIQSAVITQATDLAERERERMNPASWLISHSPFTHLSRN